MASQKQIIPGRPEGFRNLANMNMEAAGRDRHGAMNYHLAALEQDRFDEQMSAEKIARYKEQRLAKRAARSSDDGSMWGGAAGMALGILLAIPTGGLSLAAIPAMATSGAALGSAGAAIGGAFDKNPSGRDISGQLGSAAKLLAPEKPQTNPHLQQMRPSPFTRSARLAAQPTAIVGDNDGVNDSRMLDQGSGGFRQAGLPAPY